MGADSSYKKSPWWDSHVHVQSRCLYLSWSLKCSSLAVVRDNSSSHPKADSCIWSWVLVQHCWKEPVVTRSPVGIFCVSPKAWRDLPHSLCPHQIIQELCYHSQALSSQNSRVVEGKCHHPYTQIEDHQVEDKFCLGHQEKLFPFRCWKPSPLRPRSRGFPQDCSCSWCH